MLTWQKYDVAVDIWSTGCIFAEMLEGKPLFPGKDRTSSSYFYVCEHRSALCADVNQFSIITELLGTPPDDVIATIASENVRMNKSVIRLISLLIPGSDFAVCQELAEAGKAAFQVEVEVQ